jgi:hypothetical protein
MTDLTAARKPLGVGLGALLASWLVVGVAHGLRGAGLNGEPPPNSGAFKGFVDTMTDNAVWIIGTCVILAIVVVGALFFFGHTRAQDYAMKIAAGIALIVLAPGIAA